MKPVSGDSSATSGNNRNIHGNTFSVDSSQIGVFEEGDQVSLSSFLKCHDSRGLETEIGLDADK